MVCGFSSASPRIRITRVPDEFDLNVQVRAEAAQHPFGMIAGRHGSITVVMPGVLSPASRIALLTCAEATGRRYSIGTAGAGSAHGQRQAAAGRR
jgi:hypothetical protein